MIFESRETSLSMLDGLRASDPMQWERFVSLYSPLVYEWCRRGNVSEHDSADVLQEVFRAVAMKIKEFRRDREGDTFHGWLWGITRFKVLDHFRSLAKHPVPTGGTTAQNAINELPDEFPEFCDESQIRDDLRVIYQRALAMLETDFKPPTWQAFWRVTIEEHQPADVASDLGMSLGAVYNAKYKVLRRLKEEFADLI